MAKHTRRQRVILASFCACQFCNAMCLSQQPPFFPGEAASKGVPASEYGFIFGFFELAIFFLCPLYGKYANRIGIKFVNNAGIVTVGVMYILFGCLDKVQRTSTFISLAFAIRMGEAIGISAFITSCLTIIVREFPVNVGAAFATEETCFGLGMIVGPALGGLLYEWGGFPLPYIVMGCVLLLASTLVHFVVPFEEVDPTKASPSAGVHAFKTLRMLPFALSSFTIMTAAVGIGYIFANLEPHLDLLGLKPFHRSLMFILSGITYTISAPCWGVLIDKKLNPRSAIVAGSLLAGAAFLLMGPAPFIPLRTTLASCIISLLLHGLGIGSELISTFIGTQRDAVRLGYPDDVSTYCMVSGFWTSSFALGSSMGSAVGGILFDTIGFRWGAVVVACLHLTVAALTSIYISRGRTANRPPGLHCNAVERAPGCTEHHGFVPAPKKDYGACSTDCQLRP